MNIFMLIFNLPTPFHNNYKSITIKCCSINHKGIIKETRPVRQFLSNNFENSTTLNYNTNKKIVELIKSQKINNQNQKNAEINEKMEKKNYARKQKKKQEKI